MRRALLVLAVLCVAASVPPIASGAVLPPGNLTVNGGFEQPAISQSWTLVSSMPGWTSTNGCQFEIWRSLAAPAEGAQSLELDSDGCLDGIRQTQSIATTPGATYEVQFWLAARSANVVDNGVHVTFGGINETVFTANTNWVLYTYRMVATATSTDLTVRDVGANNGFGTRLDAVSVVRDGDSDGVSDSGDNCRDHANANQADADRDGQGDVCDADDDNDGVPDGSDLCAGTPSGTTVAGDGCADPDTDGVSTQAGDNCPGTANPDQADNDRDNIGDVCDPNDDNDAVNDASDNCQFVANDDQANNDADADGDVCDPNDDNDGVDDGGDNCRFVANDDQANNDADADGDACDPNDDNDAVNDATDNCQFVANDDQANNDADANGDACDADDDNDGVDDGGDNCRFVANPGQRDDDHDGIGDACDGTFDSNDGKASGGGWVTSSDGKVNFSSSAKSVDGKLTGNCVVTVAKTKIKCLAVDGYYQSPTNDRVVFVGTGTHDGVETRYRVEMTDDGEPGTADRFEISTDSGFAAGGVIGAGNIQVHKGL
jgi:hypothetical protein